MTLSDDLNATADIIERGWTQHQYVDDSGVCLLGGMNQALGYHPADEMQAYLCPRAKAMGKAVSEFLGEEEIYFWNDAEERTQEEVTQMLRDCAVKNQPDSMWG